MSDLLVLLATIAIILFCIYTEEPLVSYFGLILIIFLLWISPVAIVGLFLLFVLLAIRY